MPSLTFVCPWYGPDISGGAEAELRLTASRLHQVGYPVEILTTCIRDFHADWSTNHYSAGQDEVDGLPVRRFPVQKRDKAAFDRINWQLMQGKCISRQEEDIFNQEMIRCPELFIYMAQHQQDGLFIFIPYMFPTTYFGAQINPARSIIIPCLHNEGYARLHIHQAVFTQVKALVFHVSAEKKLADAFYQQGEGQLRPIIGEGVETTWQANGQRFREKYNLVGQPFVLYAGRRDPGKNMPLLIQYWLEYVHASGRDVKLVLIGPGEMTLLANAQSHIIDLGFVPKQDKYDAYAAADIFCLPSVNESFSIVLMESWLAETPALVHGHCEVTREHCQRANAGLYFTNFAEFSAAVTYLLAEKETAVSMGKLGRQYVLDNYQWETIIDKYTQLITEVAETES